MQALDAPDSTAVHRGSDQSWLLVVSAVQTQRGDELRGVAHLDGTCVPAERSGGAKGERRRRAVSHVDAVGTDGNLAVARDRYFRHHSIGTGAKRLIGEREPHAVELGVIVPLLLVAVALAPERTFRREIADFGEAQAQEPA